MKSRSVGAARASLGPNPPAQLSPGKATKSIDASVASTGVAEDKTGAFLLGLM